jgi:hypothetical protein
MTRKRSRTSHCATTSKGGKWDGLHAFLSAHPGVFDMYDWIWLPDDDIATTTESINRLFDIASHHGLELAQPSLTWDSYISHFITAHNPRFHLRWTNFVEVMAPLLRSAALRRIFPSFAGRKFGMGLDFLWSRWMPEPSFRTAIIDSVSVRHTRPVGKGNLSSGAEIARTSELEDLLARYALGRPPHSVVYAGLDADGRLLRGARLWANLYRGWRPLHRLSTSQPQFPIKANRLLRRVWRMTLSPANLTPLPLPFELHARR